VVTDVNVRLSNFWHPDPDDVDILLVAPDGRQATLMSDAGGATDVSDIYLTFDDEALFPLPQSTALKTGTFRPGNYGEDVDSFPAPAPAATERARCPSSTARTPTASGTCTSSTTRVPPTREWATGSWGTGP
jgi:hypothetical protein